MQVEYVDKNAITQKERGNIGILIPGMFAKKNSDRHSPTSKNTLRVVVKMISECEK
jgi:hypothetical protein